LTQRRSLTRALALGLAVTAVSYLPSFAAAERIDRAIYDLWSRLTAPAPPSDIVLVDLEDPAWLDALIALGRRDGARLLVSTLAQAPAVQPDAVLGPVAVTASGTPLLRPTAWSEGGHLWIEPDSDGVVRWDRPVLEGETTLVSLPLAALDVLGGASPAGAREDEGGLTVNGHRLTVDAAGHRELRFYRPHAFPDLKPAELAMTPGLLAEKIVVAGRGDAVHSTPVGPLTTRELVAHALAGYRQDLSVHASLAGTVPGWILAVLAVGLLAGGGRASSLRRAAVPATGLAALLGGSLGAFAWGSLWLPVAGPALLLLVTGGAAAMAASPQRLRSTERPQIEATHRVERGHCAAGVPNELGRYELVEKIAEGTAGTVYLGRDPKINRTVAIKVIDLAAKIETDDLDAARQDFLREAETAGRLSHPNIVTVFDVGETDGFAYLAMEFLRGRRLSEYTREDTLLPVAPTLELIARAAEALGYAHRQNVVHRDIKPANIMYDSVSDNLKITDFGIARWIDASRTRTGIVLGTPSFMSPEQVEGENVNGHTDLFALGVSLYQLLTGRLPFQGNSMTHLMFVIANEAHRPLTVARPGLPARLDEVIDTALAKDPARRFRSGTEMATVLRRVAAEIG
jgi:hypothetical protein